MAVTGVVAVHVQCLAKIHAQELVKGVVDVLALAHIAVIQLVVAVVVAEVFIKDE